MKKTLKQLEEENADIINDKILQEICEWYYVYRIRLKQGLSIEYSYNFVNERKHSELMAFLRMTDYDKIRGINLIKK